MGKFDGKVALVTGGASGMGYAIAKRLAAEGAQVTIADINEPLAKQAVSEIGNNIQYIAFDQSDFNQVQETINKIEQKFGGLDLAVNAAAIHGPVGALEDLEPKDIQKVMAVNFTAVAFCIKYETLAMKKRGGGAIVNFASISGMRPSPYLAIYSAAKAGILAMTDVAATEAARHNIRINVISPGYVDTPMLPPAIDRKWAASLAPIQRCGTPDDIADAVTFLLSSEAKQIVGSNLVVDGGVVSSLSIKPPGY